MKYSNTLWRGLAICLGVAATGADGFNTLSHAVNAKMTIDIVATVAVIIVVMALSLPISVWAFKKQNFFNGALCAVVFVTAWAVSYGFSINRMGSNRMNEAQKIGKSNLASSIALEKIVKASDILDQAKNELAKEAVDGKGPRWKFANNRAQQAEIDLKNAENAYLDTGPMQHSQTFDQTAYLVYLLPFVAQAAGVVFFLIAFGELKNTPKRASRREHSKHVIEQLKQSVPDERAVLDYLKSCADNGDWASRYRDISKASGISIGAVKNALNTLENEKEIIVDGCTKGRGTWGRVVEHA